MPQKLAAGAPVRSRRPYAFPSGHTSSAFAAAGVGVKHYGWKWGALAEAAALYVGLSRLQENKHYVSDVIGGAVLAAMSRTASPSVPMRRGKSPSVRSSKPAHTV